MKHTPSRSIRWRRMPNRWLRSVRRWAVFAGIGLLAPAAAAQSPSTAPASATQQPTAVTNPSHAEIERLVESALSTDPDAAELAGQKLVQRFIEPVEAALGAVGTRPDEQQLRIRKLLGRLHAALRVRLMRADLPGEDRELLDSFMKTHATLVERLFDDDPRVRLAAVRQIPLTRDSGAGVLLARKADDADGEVAEAALEAAAELADGVTARGLARYATGAIAALQGGVYGADQQEIATVVALFASRCVLVMGQVADRQSLPAAIDAARYLIASPYREIVEVEPLLHALSQFQDERVAPLLLELLDESQLVRTTPDPAGRAAVQTVGDAALWNLLKLYGLKPDALRMFTPEQPPRFAGFFSDADRALAVQAFRIWQRANAGKPREQRGPLELPQKANKP